VSLHREQKKKILAGEILTALRDFHSRTGLSRDELLDELATLFEVVVRSDLFWPRAKELAASGVIGSYNGMNDSEDAMDELGFEVEEFIRGYYWTKGLACGSFAIAVSATLVFCAVNKVDPCDEQWVRSKLLSMFSKPFSKLREIPIREYYEGNEELINSLILEAHRYGWR